MDVTPALTCNNVQAHVRSNIFWIYVLALIIAIVISWYLFYATQQDTWWNNLDKSWIVPPLPVWMLGSALLLIIDAYITYVASHLTTTKYRNWLNLALGLVLLFFVLWVIIFFGQRNPRLAMLFAILLLLAVIWQMWIIWQVHSSLNIPMIMVLIGTIILLIDNWSLINSNP